MRRLTTASRAYIFVTNHISFLDAAIIVKSLPATATRFGQERNCKDPSIRVYLPEGYCNGRQVQPG